MSEDPPSRSLLARLVRAVAGQTREAEPQNGGASPVPILSPGGDLLRNVQQFHEKRVQDVMVPRADIIAVDLDTPLRDLAKLFSDAAHSRLPVYRETLDDPVGVVHIKDVVGHLSRLADPGEDSEAWGETRILPAIRRPLLYVPASMRALDLLLKMQSRRQHMALVVDEFGGTDGLVTWKDLIGRIRRDMD